MAEVMTARFRDLREIYETKGVAGISFSVTRFLLKQPLPHPYSTRFSFRSQLLEEAVTNRAASSLSFTDALRVHWQGFDERLYHLYRFDEVCPDEYLSEYSRSCAGYINDDIETLRNKESFHAHLAERGFERYLPDLFGYVDGGRFESTDGRTLETIAREEGRLVIKGVTGGGGNGVFICDWDGSEIQLYGKDGHVGGFESIRAEFDRSIVTEYCEQAEYLDEIYPRSPNTLRVLALHPDDGEPFVPAAVHRFGTSHSGALDNFSQGGLSANISLDDGTLSAGAGVSDDHHVQWYDAHPDTDARIRGTRIPGWPSIKDEFLSLAAELPEVKYAGWDLLVTAPGEFVIIETNHFPDPDVLQVHEPLLDDRRVREFFEENDVPI